MGTQPRPPKRSCLHLNQDAGAPQDFRSLIAKLAANPPPSIKAHTFLRDWPTASKPVALLCNGGQTYVVKALQVNNGGMARVLVNDQIVGRLAELLQAPVPLSAFIEVPLELISNQAQMSHMIPGVSYGSKFIENVTERMAIEHANIPENRARFALLAMLFGGWVPRIINLSIVRVLPIWCIL